MVVLASLVMCEHALEVPLIVRYQLTRKFSTECPTDNPDVCVKWLAVERIPVLYLQVPIIKQPTQMEPLNAAPTWRGHEFS